MTEAIQQNRYQDNCLCKPLIKFHGKIVKTFDSLPEQGCVIQEIATRIIRIAVAILAYPLLGLLALAGAATQNKSVQPVIPTYTVTKEQSDQLKERFFKSLENLIEDPVKTSVTVFIEYDTKNQLGKCSTLFQDGLKSKDLQDYFKNITGERTISGFLLKVYCIEENSNRLTEYHADFSPSSVLSWNSINPGKICGLKDFPSDCGYHLNEDKTDFLTQ